ncbi:hypothetical protein [Streptomyces qaidamensis]|nr:hypothetical protein [Streptomyces qaidamensis]
MKQLIVVGAPDQKVEGAGETLPQVLVPEGQNSDFGAVTFVDWMG